MVNAVNALSGGLSVTAGVPAGRSPNLDAQLATCRAQLADWVTCPSAKTPEGKAKIAQITTRFDAIEQQIKQADETATRLRAARPAVSQAFDSAAAPTAQGTSRPSSAGDRGVAIVYGPRGDDIRPPGAGLDVFA